METREVDDRRTTPRLASGFMVRGRIHAKWDLLSLKDVSQDGARLVCDGTCDPDEPVELLLSLPVVTEPLQVGAHVVWQRPLGSGQRFHLTELGLHFTSPDPSTRQMIGEGVQRLLKHESGTIESKEGK